MFVSDPYIGIRSFNIENRTDIQLLGTAEDGGAPMSALASGNRFYTADLFNGLSVFDITDPAVPQFLSSVPLSGVSSAITGWSGGLIVSDQWNGI